MKLFFINNAGFPVLLGFIVLPIFALYFFGSKSSSSNETNVFETTVGADNGAISAYGSSISVIDGGAFDFGKKALDYSQNTFTEVITALGTTFSDALNLVDRTGERATRQSAETLEIASQVQEKDSTEISKIVLIGAGIVAAIAIAPKILK